MGGESRSSPRCNARRTRRHFYSDRSQLRSLSLVRAARAHNRNPQLYEKSFSCFVDGRRVHVDAAGCEIVDTSEKSRALAQRFEKSTHTRANH